MVINDYNGKIYIELTEDKLILYRRFSKKELNLKDIKASYLTDDYLLKFIYKDKLKSYIINNIRFEDKYMLEEIEYGIGPKKNKFSIKNEFTFDYNSIYKEYLFKKGKKKLKFSDNIIYPQYYKEELRKLSEKKMIRDKYDK